MSFYKSKKAVDQFWDSMDDNPLIIISKLRSTMAESKTQWADECVQFVDDEDFTHVLKLVMDLMDGTMPDPSKVSGIIVRLEAYAVKFRMQSNAYMSYKKGTNEANAKKNHYYSMVAGIERLCDGLKYLLR